MKYHPKNTLAHLLQHPALMRMDWSEAKCSVLAKNIGQFKENHQAPKPEVSALTFYAMNHLVGVIRRHYGMYDPLPEWAVTVIRDYTEWLSVEARRMVGYITLICTRESRHWPNAGHYHGKFVAQFGEEAWKFFLKIEGGSSMGTMQAFISNPPDTTMGTHLAAHSYIFNEAWQGMGGYGGPKWGNIADTLLRTIRGETSLEVMVDTSWTLAHNGGPMFNKGMLYSHYGHHLLTILDVQRSGQIPQLIRSKLFDAEFKVPAFVHQAIAAVSDHLEPISGYVDFEAVEQLGGKHAKDYSAYKKVFQHKKHEAIPGLIKNVQIMPGVFVPSIERKKKAA